MRSFRFDWRLRSRFGVGAMLAAHAGLLVVGDLSRHPWATLGLLALAFSGLFEGIRSGARSGGVSIHRLLWVAIALRLLLLPLTPTLSDDVLRYVWDGRVLTAGLNPYELAPEDPQLAELRDAAWEVMPHKEVATVYPPAALALFSIAARLPQPVYVLKTVLASIDLLGVWMLACIARRRGLPASRVALYAWNPLATLEVAGMGHVDALGVTAMIGVVLALQSPGGAAPRAAACAAVGTLAKLVPAVAAPMWARQSGRPWRFLMVLGTIVGLAALPVVVASGGAPPGLVEYAVSWDFNGPLFEPLWRILDGVGAPEGIARLLDAAKEATGAHAFWNRFYPYRYPQFLAKLVLGLAIVGLLFRSLGRREPISGSGWLLGGVMLCSTTVYPWYLLWILPWAALSRQRAWLALSALVQISYLPQLLEVDAFPWYYLAVWLPFGWMLARSPRWSID